MSTPPITRVIVIQNPQGLHARPALLFAHLAMQYQSKIELILGSQRADAKSPLHLMTMGAAKGTRLTLEAEGQDAAEAIEALANLVDSGFGIDEDEVQQEQQEQQGG